MRKILITLLMSAFALQSALAGGNSSVVELDKVTSIKIEDEKITVVGTGMIRKRVRSDAAHGDTTVFGQPAQMMHAQVTDCTFVIVPYHVNDDLKGVPGPSPKDMTPEMLAQSKKWWKGTLESATRIKVGDAITIGYQREQMTLTSVYVTKIVGSGSLSKRKANKE